MSVTTVFLLPVMRFAKLNKSPPSLLSPPSISSPPSKVLEKNKPPGGLIEDLRLVDLVTLIVHSYFDTLLRYVLSVTFCGAVVMKVMDQKTLVKRRWSYKVRRTVYILTLSKFARHEFTNLWLEAFCWTLPDTLSLSLTWIRLGPKQARRVNDSTAIAYSRTIDDYRNSPTIKFCTDLVPAHRCPSAIKFKIRLEWASVNWSNVLLISKAYFPANKMNWM